ncbi:Dynein heavy chain 17, axonemal [Merluccius polli]|uniref:Dynein heavy chain 17, axonemal n=1 Tax=Merluccius polli TaxID=89951 RepID=A0AA47P2R5_MERPO|nr:Dynein heavy chain 17, axonemal [Merluccius polli]
MDPMLIHACETLVIDWTHQINNVLKEDSASPILQGLNPLPSNEFDFWNNRLVNLEGLYAQVQYSVLCTQTETSLQCSPGFQPHLPLFSVFIFFPVNSSQTLREARDVVMYLKPVQKILDAVGQTEYAQLITHIRAVMHTVSLTWANSEYYCRPARIVVILKEICNLFIDMVVHSVSSALCCSDLKSTLE